jgi:uncharacterized protein (TIGR02453 family)
MNKGINMNNAEFNGFKPSVLQFLKELEINNNRDWFSKNKIRYEDDVLIPALNFVSEIGNGLPNVSKHFTAIPKRMGGSIMRIYRDTRFSKDKTPYKTNIGIQFRHQFAKDVHAPGYYVHIAADECFIGVGTWRPPSDALLKIREHIAEHSKKWVSIRDDKQFNMNFKLSGDKLKTAPRGFDKEHELIDDLRWKDFIAVHNLNENDIQKVDFTKRTTELFKSAEPYMKFLCEAVGVPF